MCTFFIYYFALCYYCLWILSEDIPTQLQEKYVLNIIRNNKIACLYIYYALYLHLTCIKILHCCFFSQQDCVMVVIMVMEKGFRAVKTRCHTTSNHHHYRERAPKEKRYSIRRWCEEEERRMNGQAIDQTVERRFFSFLTRFFSSILSLFFSQRLSPTNFFSP